MGWRKKGLGFIFLVLFSTNKVPRAPFSFVLIPGWAEGSEPGQIYSHGWREELWFQ